MLQIIIKQLINRWRANVWIYIELLLVFCLVWFMVDYFFVLQFNRSLPSCRDINHTWLVDVAQLPAESPDYQPGESDSTALEANYARLLDRLRHFDGIEAVAVMDGFAVPGSGSYWGSNLASGTDSTALSANGQRVSFDLTTDYFKVFRITHPDGKLVDAKDFDLTTPHALILSDLGARKLFPGQQATGKELFNTQDADEHYVVKGVVGDVKRFNFKRPHVVYYVPEASTAANIPQKRIAIRSSESIADARFSQSFGEQMAKELRIGNFYLKKLTPFSKIEQTTEMRFGMTNDYRIRTALMLFFLLNVMLCVGGTFWYRISQRREEVGLRMALGSTHAGIRTLLYAEGLCLLTAVAIPAMLIEGQFVYLDMIFTLGANDEVYLPDRLLLRFLITNALTYLFLALSILLSIWLPAGKASKMEPAEALHYE